MNSKPGNPWLTEIVNIAHTSDLSSDVIRRNNLGDDRRMLGKHLQT